VIGVTDPLPLPRDLSAREAPESMQAAPLRFCVLTDGTELAAWQSAALGRLAALPQVQADGWLIHEPPGGAPGGLDSKALRIAGLAPGTAPRVVHTSAAGALSAAEASLLGARSFDFILSFVSVSAARCFAGLARWGVWQFVFGDWHADRGRHGAFWAIVRDEPVAQAALVQLQDDPDCVRVLIEGAVRSHAFRAAAHECMLQERCVHWPAQMCLELQDGRVERLHGPLLRAGPAGKGRRRLGARVRFAASAARRAVRENLGMLLLHEQWNIGILDVPIAALLSGRELPQPRWLPAPRNAEFYADPFGIVRDGRLHILFERMDYRTGVGSLAAFEADSNEMRPVEIGRAMHLSYPFLLEHEGRLLCIPETLDANEVALYEPERFPDRWRRVGALVSGQRLCDGTVFQHEGRWWLAASRPERRGASCELLLFHAAQLSGPWVAHAANPVKVDARSARPAGTPFVSEGVLYRPAQDCAADYGCRVVINRVLTLTERSFREEPCALIEPPRSWPYAAGLHTVCAVGDRTIIDAKRKRFIVQQCAQILRFSARKALRRFTAARPRP